LTGSSYAIFNILLNKLPDVGINSNLTNNNKLLLFLINLKLGVTFSALGVLFNIYRTTASRIFINLLSILCEKTKHFIFWPSKETISETLPYVFKKNYPNCRCIIDCTEIKVEQLPTVEQRVCMYSRYKSAYTIKCHQMVLLAFCLNVMVDVLVILVLFFWIFYFSVVLTKLKVNMRG